MLNVTGCRMDRNYVVVADDAVITRTHMTTDEFAWGHAGGPAGAVAAIYVEEKRA